MPRSVWLRTNRLAALPVVALSSIAVVAGITRLAEVPAWLAWIPPWLLAAVAAAVGVLGTWWAEPWARRREEGSARERHALERVQAHLGRRRKLPRIGEPSARGLDLRVHRAIPQREPRASVLGHKSGPGSEPELPGFVDRDCGPDVRAWMREAGVHGGFLVLIGESAVGKTRLLYESARAELSDFAVLAPDLGDGELVNSVADATFRLPKLIIWLDELQRFLPGPYMAEGDTAVTAASLRRLLEAPTPIVVVGTLWPQYAAELRAQGQDPETRQHRTRHPGAEDVLSIRQRKEIVLKRFSQTETEAAHAIAGEDSRIEDALRIAGFSVTEALAGVPRLMERYEQSTGEVRAVIHAAADARRLGVRAPLQPALLRAAATAYPEGAAYVDEAAFSRACEELTRLDQATAPFDEVRDGDGVAYSVTDYLLQHLLRERRTEPVPAGMWTALVAHCVQAGDLRRVGISAFRRFLYPHAEAASRRAAALGDSAAAETLYRLLARQGRTSDLRQLVDSGDPQAGWWVFWEKRIPLDAARKWADEGDRHAAWILACELADQGTTGETELAVRAGKGDPAAVRRLADLWARHGRTAEAIDLLRTLVDDPAVARKLAELLAASGDVKQAADVLRDQIAAGDASAAGDLARLHARHLVGSGRPAEAVELLRVQVRSDPRDIRSRGQLIDALVTQGRIDEAISLESDRTGAAAGTVYRLSQLLARQGDIAWLRELADAGHDEAAQYLAQLLATPAHVGELETRARAGDWHAAGRFARYRAQDATIAELSAAAQSGDDDARARLTENLADRRDVDGLQALVDDGHGGAIGHLAKAMAEHGQEDQAIALLQNAGAARTLGTDYPLARHLAKRGDTGRLTTLADSGSRPAVVELVNVFAARGDAAELRHRTADGETQALRALVDLLNRRGEDEAALALLEEHAPREPAPSSFNPDHFDIARMLSEQLARCGRFEQLHARAAQGGHTAVLELGRLLIKRGTPADAVALLAPRVDNGERQLSGLLAEALQAQGNAGELRARADAGDIEAGWHLAQLLDDRGDAAQLRTLAERGVLGVGYQRLAGLLARQGDVEELRSLVNAGHGGEAALAGLLARNKDVASLRDRAQTGDRAARQRLSEVLRRQGEMEGLRALADCGDPSVARSLAKLLADTGRIDELRERAAAERGVYAEELATVLVGQHTVDDAIAVLRERVRAGSDQAAKRLVALLTAVGRVDDLWTEVQAGTCFAGAGLRDWLSANGYVEECKRLERYGITAGGSIADESATPFSQLLERAVRTRR